MSGNDKKKKSDSYDAALLDILSKRASFDNRLSNGWDVNVANYTPSAASTTPKITASIPVLEDTSTTTSSRNGLDTTSARKRYEEKQKEGSSNIDSSSFNWGAMTDSERGALNAFLTGSTASDYQRSIPTLMASLDETDQKTLTDAQNKVKQLQTTTGDAMLDDVLGAEGIAELNKGEIQVQKNKIDDLRKVNYAKSYSDTNTIDKWLDSDYKMSDGEVEQAKQIINDYEIDSEGSKRNNFTDTDRDRMSALKDKVSKSESALYGAMNALVDPIMQKADDNYYGWTTEDLANEASKVTNISAATQEQVDAIDAQIAEYQNQLAQTNNSTGDAAVDEAMGLTGLTSNGIVDTREKIDELEKQRYKLILGDEDDPYGYKARKANAQTQNQAEYVAGDLATRAVETAIGNNLMEGTSYGNTIDKIFNAKNSTSGKVIADALKDAPIDALTDTLPEYASNKASGMSDDEVNKQLLINIALNMGINLGVSGLQNISEIKSAIKNAKNVSDSDKQVLENIADAVEATETKEVADTIPALAEEAAETPVEKTLAESIADGTATNKQIEEVLGNADLKKQVEQELNIDLSDTKANNRRTLQAYRNKTTSDTIPALTENTSPITEGEFEEGIEGKLSDYEIEQLLKETDESDILAGDDQFIPMVSKENTTASGNVSGNVIPKEAEEPVDDFAERVVKSYNLPEGEPFADTIRQDIANGDYSMYRNQMLGVITSDSTSDASKEEARELLDEMSYRTLVGNDGKIHLTIDGEDTALDADEVRQARDTTERIAQNYREEDAEAASSNIRAMDRWLAENEGASEPIEEITGELPKAESTSETVNSSLSPLEETAETTTSPEVPELKERGYAESIRTKTDMDEETIKAFEDDPELYAVLKNKTTKAKADEIYASTIDASDAATKTRELLKSQDPAALPLGYSAAKELIENGRRDEAVQLIREMSESLTQSGQFSQAAYITMMQNDPITALKYLQGEIDQLNSQGLEKFGAKKWKDFKLTDEEIDALNKLEVGDGEGIKAVYDSIGKRIQKEYPSTFKEKLTELRHLGMLLNPRTHLRNTGANVISTGVRSFSDRVSAVGQRIASIGNKDMEITQSLTGSIGGKYKKGAEEIFEARKADILGLGKYEEDAAGGMVGYLGDAKKQKQVFKDNNIVTGINKMLSDSKVVSGIDKAMNKISGGKISETYLKDLLGEKMTGSALENLRQFNYYMLGTVEDDPFVKKNFVNRLASYMKAQGITDVSKVSEEAIEIAKNEALKATFKDNNRLTELFSDFKKKTGIFGDMVLPFAKTPANLAVRSYEYSPAGVISTVSNSLNRNKKIFKDVSQAEKALAGATSDTAKQAAQEALDAARKAANTRVAQTMDDLSKNLTGTGLIAAGVMLANKGIITKAYSDDANEAAFQKQQGYLPYAIHIGDHYYTYDWAQPTSIGLIIGTEIADAMDDNDTEGMTTAEKAKNIANSVKNGGIAAVDAWFDQSPLQSLQEIMGGGEYSSDSVGENIYNQATNDYPLSFIPALSGAIARTNDTTMRNTTDQTSWLNSFASRAEAKIPGLSENLPASYDTWGRERKRSGDGAEAAFAQLVNPGQLGYNNKTEIDDAITDLYNTTGDSSVFPHKVSSYASITYADGTKKELNNTEVSNYQKAMGETSYDGAEALINSLSFQNLTDESKANALNTVYNLADKLAQRDLFDNPISDSSSYSTLADIYEEQGAEGLAEYICSDEYNSEIKNTIKGNGLPYNDATRSAWDSEDTTTLDAWRSAQEIANEHDIDNATEAMYKKFVSGGEEGLNSYLDARDKVIADYGIESPSDTLIQAEIDGDKTTLNKYANVSKIAEGYGLTASQAVVNAYDTYGERGIKLYSEAKDIAENDYGMSLNEDMLEAYASGGENGVKTYVEQKNMADSYGLSYNDTFKSIVNSSLGEKGVKVYANCPKSESGSVTLENLCNNMSSLSDREKGILLKSVVDDGKQNHDAYNSSDPADLWKFYKKKYVD